MVVTPVHPGVKMKSSQMNDVNTDYANRSGFHQTHNMEQTRFKWGENGKLIRNRIYYLIVLIPDLFSLLKELFEDKDKMHFIYCPYL